ncbi:hypothetical protein [Syntrophomonas curvata]
MVVWGGDDYCQPDAIPWRNGCVRWPVAAMLNIWNLVLVVTL